jgi:diguanylate cyclase
LLANRTFFHERLSQFVSEGNRSERKFALVMADTERFEAINDAFGRHAGDQLLGQIAERLARCVGDPCLRGSDTASRQGGDEFLMLLTEVTWVQDTGVIADKLKKAMAEPHLIGNHQIRVTLSIGISLYPDDGKDVESLLSHADTAMYFAKRSGRNTYRRFIPDMITDPASATAGLDISDRDEHHGLSSQHNARQS